MRLSTRSRGRRRVAPGRPFGPPGCDTSGSKVSRSSTRRRPRPRSTHGGKRLMTRMAASLDVRPARVSGDRDRSCRGRARRQRTRLGEHRARDRATTRSLQNAATQLVITNAQLVEIGRLEIARVSTLGIAGFDAPKSGMAMTESADAFDGVRELYEAVAPSQWSQQKREWHLVDSTFRAAAANLRANPDFLTFDRLRFIADFATPAARALDGLRRALATQPVVMRRPWRFDVPSVYDEGAFAAADYLPAAAPRPTPELLALGARLFADARLSGTRMVEGLFVVPSIPSHAFTDGRRTASSIDRFAMVTRHTPTLLNAAIQPAQFVDERAASLEAQVGEVLRSPAEMAGLGGTRRRGAGPHVGVPCELRECLGEARTGPHAASRALGHWRFRPLAGGARLPVRPRRPR